MDHHNAGLKYNLVTFAAANFDDYKMFDGVGFYFIGIGSGLVGQI